MKAVDMRNKTVADLKSELVSLLKELFNLRMQKGIGQLTQTHLLKRVKKRIACVKTLLNEKEG